MDTVDLQQAHALDGADDVLAPCMPGRRPQQSLCGQLQCSRLREWQYFAAGYTFAQTLVPSRNGYTLILLLLTAPLLTCPRAGRLGHDDDIVQTAPPGAAWSHPMKKRTPTLLSSFGIALLTTGAAWAQTQSSPTPPMPATQSTPSTAPATSPSPGASGNAQSSNSQTYNTSQGQVTINSTVPSGPSTASPPSFEQLSGGKKYITKDDANAYPPLANDFLFVSHNANRITKTQYERWVKNLN
jgi:hypothetical protein